MTATILWLLAIGVALALLVAWGRALAKRNRRINRMENLPSNDGVGGSVHSMTGMGAMGIGAAGDAGGCAGGSGGDCG